MLPSSLSEFRADLTQQREDTVQQEAEYIPDESTVDISDGGMERNTGQASSINSGRENKEAACCSEPE